MAHQIVYSTDPNYQPEPTNSKPVDTLPPARQNLRVKRDSKNRKGKTVTLVTGFNGSESDLKNLGKSLKTACGCGGSVRDGEIIIQGDVTEKIMKLLQEKGFHAKQAGG